VGACYVRGTASWSGPLAARLRYEVEQTNKRLGQVRLCRVEVGGFSFVELVVLGQTDFSSFFVKRCLYEIQDVVDLIALFGV